MSVREIAEDVVEMFKAGKFHEVGEKYWADDVVSTEAMGPPGMDLVARGIEAVRAKGKWFVENNDTVNGVVEGPFVNGDTFAVHSTADITSHADGVTRHMSEICLYTLKDGKIVEETFLY